MAGHPNLRAPLPPTEIDDLREEFAEQLRQVTAHFQAQLDLVKADVAELKKVVLPHQLMVLDKADQIDYDHKVWTSDGGEVSGQSFTTPAYSTLKVR